LDRAEDHASSAHRNTSQGTTLNTDQGDIPEGKGEEPQTFGNEYLDRAEAEEGVTKIFFINEKNLVECPHVKIKIGGREVIALLDTGAECSVMSEKLFTSLINDGMKLLYIPVVNCLLSTAFGRKSRRVKRQALIEFRIGEQLYELTVIVAPAPVTDIILGSDLINEYAVNLYCDILGLDGVSIVT
jgi:hypothetical protein